jgi:hypothetical protein
VDILPSLMGRNNCLQNVRRPKECTGPLKRVHYTLVLAVCAAILANDFVGGVVGSVRMIGSADRRRLMDNHVARRGFFTRLTPTPTGVVRLVLNYCPARRSVWRANSFSGEPSLFFA